MSGAVVFINESGLSLECLDVKAVGGVDVQFRAIKVGHRALPEMARSDIAETGLLQEQRHLSVVVAPLVRAYETPAPAGKGIGRGDVLGVSPEQPASFLCRAFTCAGKVGATDVGEVGNGNAQAAAGNEDAVAFAQYVESFPAFHVFENLGAVDEIHVSVRQRQAFPDVHELDFRPRDIVAGRQETKFNEETTQKRELGEQGKGAPIVVQPAIEAAGAATEIEFDAGARHVFFRVAKNTMPTKTKQARLK